MLLQWKIINYFYYLVIGNVFVIGNVTHSWIIIFIKCNRYYKYLKRKYLLILIILNYKKNYHGPRITIFVLTAYEIINNENFFTNYSNNVRKINYLCLTKL